MLKRLKNICVTIIKNKTKPKTLFILMVLCLEKLNTISIFIVSLLMFYDHSEMPYAEITTDDIIKSLVTLCMNISMCVSD